MVFNCVRQNTMQNSLTWCIDSNSVQDGGKSHFIKKLLEQWNGHVTYFKKLFFNSEWYSHPFWTDS